MYFPIGWPKYLQLPDEDEDPVQCIVANRERTLFAVVTLQAIHLWQCKPCVLIVSYRRSDDSIVVLGTNCGAEWKPDSSVIAVATSGGHLLLLKVVSESNQRLYATKQSGSYHYKRDVTEADTIAVPKLKVTFGATFQVTGGVACLCCLKDEMLVATGQGLLRRITWEGIGRSHLDVSIRSVPFSLDLQQSRESLLEDPSIHFKQLEYSVLLGGFAVVLSDGRAAFLTSETTKFSPKGVHAVWAPDVSNATCVAVNHKYRLIVFGLANGQGIVFAVDEITGAMLVSHRLTLSTSDFPDGCQAAGAVTCLRWTPEGSAVIMSWKKGGFSLWSTFGALLVCTLGGDFCPDPSRSSLLQIQSMEWGPEGYNLWATKKPSPNSGLPDNSPDSTGNLIQLSFVKSALTMNPCMANCEHLLLQGERHIYLSCEGTVVKAQSHSDLTVDESIPGAPAVNGTSKESACSSNILAGNKQWHCLQIPQNYLDSNWPIRHATVDRIGQCIAVSGRYGLAHCTLGSKRWKIFGNVTQEKDMSVSGGLCWWGDYIVAACFNHYESREELRVYPRGSNLDNAFAFILKVPFQVLLLNVFKDLVIVFCADYHISLFSLETKEGPATPSATLTRIQDLSLANFVPHPSSLVSLTLTSLRTESVSTKLTNQSYEAESLIINVAGRVLMLQRDRSRVPMAKNDYHDRRKNKEAEIPFLAPIVLASSVENMWTTTRSSSIKPHLMESLWLGCGAAGMKVWLPLFPNQSEKQHHSFLSKRIMLPFQLRIYPLAVLFEDAVVLGASCDLLNFEPLTPSVERRSRCPSLPFTTLERTTQIYLHHILRQLLRRNLGMHALQIARSCMSLPYFSHVLELMLHEVLEEEATASEPIPDALLPRVVAFIQEFPQYLETVVHCARKTEIALWPYLFASVGNPQDLFEECLRTGSLQTAASYLIILQNLETVKASKHHATQLLDAALEHCEWSLCRDLLRFLRAIGSGDGDSARTPPPLANHHMFPLGVGMAAVSGNVPKTRGRHPSHSSKASLGSEKQAEQSSGDKRSLSRQNSLPDSTAEEFYIDLILSRHAKKLLTAYRLRELGMFAGYLDFKLTSWLVRERTRVARVDSFVDALQRLHSDFNWPLPLVGSPSGSKHVSRATTPSGNPLNGVHTPAESPSSPDNLFPSVGYGGMGRGNTQTRATTPPNTAVAAASGSNSSSGQGGVVNHKLLRTQSTLSESTNSETRTEEAMLKHPSAKGSDETSIGTTEASEGSLLGEGDNNLEDSFWSNNVTVDELEQFFREIVQNGPKQSERELRYLLKIVLESSCLEWGLLIAIILRDRSALSQVVNIASLGEAPSDVVTRMKEGLSHLEVWADTDCPAYKPLLLAIKPQASVLADILERSPSPSRSRSSSASEHSSSELKRLSSRGSLGEPETCEDEVFEEEGEEEKEDSACIIS
ncbi:guanine nucleotide exchange factor subunit RIC1-like [Diadema antillarum]|uniref:guanine nucleotide exchange factor subunit RIC1-like n=1 Tax=Diadema antillarum TaxID=105358 RepID=UPI003A8AA69C